MEGKVKKKALSGMGMNGPVPDYWVWILRI